MSSHSASEPVRLNRQRIIETAILLADEGGIERLSMRLLARTLHVEAMSLYNHIANKDALLDAMVDTVIGRIDLPAAGQDWRSQMRQRALSAYSVFRRHAWAPPLVVGRMNVGPAMLAYIDATLGSLHAAGFSYPLADHAWNAMDSHIYGFILLERNFPIEAGAYAQMAVRFLPMLPAETYPHMRALTQLVAHGQHDGLHSFAFGLDLLLDGLERVLASAPH